MRRGFQTLQISKLPSVSSKRKAGIAHHKLRLLSSRPVPRWLWCSSVYVWFWCGTFFLCLRDILKYLTCLCVSLSDRFASPWHRKTAGSSTWWFTLSAACLELRWRPLDPIYYICTLRSLYALISPSPFLPPRRNSDPVTKQTLLSRPHYDTRLHFISRERFGTFFPRRLASNCAYPRYEALSAVCCWSPENENFHMIQHSTKNRDSNPRLQPS